MEIIIHGTGKMGNVLLDLIKEKQDITKDKITGFCDELTDEEGDVIIDFSHFSRLENMLNYAKNKNIPLVIGTTGYSDDIYKKIVETSKYIPILLTSNMSLGITVMKDILKKITPVLSNNFDIEIVESHHNKKIDSPSGTAKTLVEIVKENSTKDLDAKYGREGISPRKENEIGVHSLRGGTVVGEHSVIFYGNDEVIEIKHRAFSKKIFAEGALKGARVLLKKENGLYGMEDLL